MRRKKHDINFFDIFYLFPSDGRLNQFATYFLVKAVKAVFLEGKTHPKFKVSGFEETTQRCDLQFFLANPA